MKTEIGILSKYKETNSEFSSIRSYSLGDVLSAMEEFANQFKIQKPEHDENGKLIMKTTQEIYLEFKTYKNNLKK